VILVHTAGANSLWLIVAHIVAFSPSATKTATHPTKTATHPGTDIRTTCGYVWEVTETVDAVAEMIVKAATGRMA
jgi:hypothetical protein